MHLFFVSLKKLKTYMRLFFCKLKKMQKNIHLIFYMLEKLKHMDLIPWKLKNLKKHEYNFVRLKSAFKKT